MKSLPIRWKKGVLIMNIYYSRITFCSCKYYLFYTNDFFCFIDRNQPVVIVPVVCLVCTWRHHQYMKISFDGCPEIFMIRWQTNTKQFHGWTFHCRALIAYNIKKCVSIRTVTQFTCVQIWNVFIFLYV